MHDLRNRPALIGLQQERFFLEGGGSDNAAGRELLAEARALCAAMLPQAGRTSAATPLKLREVLERALRQAPGMSRSGGRGVEMRLRCRPDLEVFADPVALARVFENLLVNAVDACRGGGRISLDAQARAGGVAIVVEDTGCGMDRAALARAYRPGAHGGGGTGYGSVSLLAALEDLAAELFVQSAPGQGTRCEVRLAAAPEPDGIWLVDPDARRLARRAARLTRQGRRVLPMAGCGEAMRLLGDLRPRSLWLARGMGDPLLGELLRLAQGLDVPVGLCGEGRDWAPQVG
ncbi:MAG: ATP-binding protein [Planctomycetota bacterium]